MCAARDRFWQWAMKTRARGSRSLRRLPIDRSCPFPNGPLRMIPRYSRPEMVAIWAPQTRFKIWFEIEAHACDALAEIGVIPKESARAIWEKAGNATFDVARIDEIERVDQARRHRVPDASGRIHRPGLALRASGHDEFRRARHLPRRAVAARQRHPDRRRRRAARGAEAPRLRAQDDADDRPLARHPRRADHLRPQARAGLRRVRARPGAAGRGARGNLDLRDFRRGRHVRQYRSAASRSMWPRRWA